MSLFALGAARVGNDEAFARKRVKMKQPTLFLASGRAPYTSWLMSDEELLEWAANIDIPTPGELEGSEPIDDPPDGFATWDEWRGDRWPPSVS